MVSSLLVSAALLSLVNAHGVNLAAQGDKGSPASVGMAVQLDLARNCTNINPCQQDTSIIRDQEIANNVVNACGRTELSGNIDIGTVTEDQLAGNAVTQVQRGSELIMTIHQVNADGAGPYNCDLDETSNAAGFTQQLAVSNNIPGANGLSQASTQDFNITVAMPANMTCIGASTGNVCAVRCRNNAQAGPFGGCVAVQQTDVKPHVNTPENIETAISLADVDKQVSDDKAALPAAIAANNAAGLQENVQNSAVADAILGVITTSLPAPTQTPGLTNAGGALATASTNAGTNTGNANTNTNGNGNGKGNGNAQGAGTGNTAGAGNANTNANGNTVGRDNGNGNGRVNNKRE